MEHQDVRQGNEFKERAIQLNKLSESPSPVKWGILGQQDVKNYVKGKSFIEISYSRLDKVKPLGKKEEKRLFCKNKTALLKDCIIL